MRPTLPLLLRLELPEHIGPNYQQFGIFLLDDTIGTRVKTIEDQHMGDHNKIVIEILREWLMGEGLPATWQALIQTLRDVHEYRLAHEVAQTYL